MQLHVGYVTDEEASPDPIGFLLDALADPATLLVLGGGAIVILALLAAWARVRPLEPARERFVRRAQSYRPYVPWMLRLAIGLVVIGAGLGRALFVPNVPLEGWPYLVLTALGFLLLLGFAVRPVALLGLAAYLVALVLDPRLIVIFDVAGGLAAVAVVGPGAPSLDDLLRAAFRARPAVSRRQVPSRRRATTTSSRSWCGLAWAVRLWHPASSTSWSSTSRRWPRSTSTA